MRLLPPWPGLLLLLLLPRAAGDRVPDPGLLQRPADAARFFQILKGLIDAEEFESDVTPRGLSFYILSFCFETRVVQLDQ